MAAPALAASMADCAICSGVTGTAGLRPGVSADPVTAHEIMTLRCMPPPCPTLFRESLQRGPGGSPEVPPATWGCRRRHWRRPQAWLKAAECCLAGRHDGSGDDNIYIRA